MSSRTKDMADRGFRLPHIRSYLKFPGKKTKKNVFYDARFYPYSKTQPVFAAVGDAEIVIARPSKDKVNSIEILSTIRDIETIESSPDEAPAAILNSCTWGSLDQVPYLCVGGVTGKVKVFNALEATLAQTLIGHGSEINDLCTHPVYPYIVASGSADHSVRIWSLLPQHRKNPCLLILGHGQAHREGILTCAFHHTGRYLVSGGLDHMVCLWTIPDLSIEATKSWEDTQVIHFPHFITQAVHGNYVDCVSFYGDLILSKAAEEHKIVLWMVTGFSSMSPPPPPETAPLTHTFRDTRSGFLKTLQKDTAEDDTQTTNGEEDIPPFQRLLSFAIDASEPFYMRFSMVKPSKAYPNIHPMLAFMNTRTKLMVWDFMRLRLGHEGEIKDNPEINNIAATPAGTPAGTPAASITTPSTANADGSRKKKSRPGARTSLLHPHRSFTENGHLATSPVNGTSTSERSESLITDTNASSSSMPPEGGAGGVQSSTTTTSLSGHALRGTPGSASVSTSSPAVLPNGNTNSSSNSSSHPHPLNQHQRHYDISNPFTELKPHLMNTIQKFPKHVTARQTAWSMDGRWLVVVGESGEDGIVVLYER